MIRVIDEQGRLFGKINVIDFLVILFLVCITPMFYFAYKIVIEKQKSKTQEQKVLPKDFIELQINCLFTKLKPEIAEIISIGDKELDKDGFVIGEVVGRRETMFYFYEFDLGTAKKTIKDPVLKNIPVTLKIRAEAKGNSLYYKDKQILENGTLQFITNKYQAEVTSISLIGHGSETVGSDIKDVKDMFQKIPTLLLSIEERLNLLERKVDSPLPQNEERLNLLERKVDSLLPQNEERLNLLERKVDSLLPQKPRKR